MKIKGIDTMYFGLDIENYEERMEPFLFEFEDKKHDSIASGEDIYIEYNGIHLKIERSGMPFYAYRLTCKDFTIGFSKKRVFENPDVVVKFSSGYLWSYGYEDAFNRFMEWFKCFPVNIKQTRLSRLDICIDTDEIEFEQEDVSEMTTRAKLKVNHFVSDEYKSGRKFSGFTIGRGKPMLARIYNKSIEVKTSGKQWFMQIWLDNGWNLENDVWRIEFQIRRKALIELNIKTVEDIKPNFERLWMYLTDKWLVMKDNKKWETIKEVKEVEISPLIREVIKKGDLEGLMNQTYGLITSIAVLNEYQTIDDTMNHVSKFFKVKLIKKNETFKQLLEHKKKIYMKQLKNDEAISGKKIMLDIIE